MDVLANYSIFQELQLVHDTGYFSAMPSLEENWQQVRDDALSLPSFHEKFTGFLKNVLFHSRLCRTQLLLLLCFRACF